MNNGSLLINRNEPTSLAEIKDGNYKVIRVELSGSGNINHLELSFYTKDKKESEPHVLKKTLSQTNNVLYPQPEFKITTKFDFCKIEKIEGEINAADELRLIFER